MEGLKTRILIALFASSLLLAGCSSSSNSSAPVDDTPAGDTGDGAPVEVNGTVTAPGGAVAMFRTENTLLIALRDSIFGKAHAAISGLEPVEGALVELIQIDDDGMQVGDVITSSSTSITGDYTLTVPAGVNLAGNLIVRITGTGGVEMRAQVVEETVDINPISEFVLQKFVDDGADLENLETTSVVKLTGQVEEFDLVAIGAVDISEVLALLEDETGTFVEDQIAVIESTPGDGTGVAGSYRVLSIELGLHDDDQQNGVGTLSLDGELIDLDIADAGNGELDVTLGAEESYYANLSFFGQSGWNLYYDVEIEADGTGEVETALIDDSGVLSVESEFEEDVYDDFGWREPPSLMRWQKALNTNVFFGTQTSASVRYSTIDTNDDGVKDAIDPDARQGDEVFKALDFLVEMPATMTTADLDGDFGRVYMGAELNAGGAMLVEVDQNILGFDGASGTVDVGAEQKWALTAQGFVLGDGPAESGISFSIANNGRTFNAGEDEDLLINDTYDFFVIGGPEVEDDANPEDNSINNILVGTTLGVKLPSAQLDISNKVYKVVFLGASVINDFGGTQLANNRFEDTLTINSDGVSGIIDQELQDIEKADITAEVVATEDEPIQADVTIALEANGSAEVVVSDPEGDFIFEGYFNQDGSIGIFRTGFFDTGSQDASEIGVAILVEVSAN